MFMFFFFNDTATTEIYTLSLHDALPICGAAVEADRHGDAVSSLPLRSPPSLFRGRMLSEAGGDRKSTRLNSSHPSISYAVFCLKKKTKHWEHHKTPLNRHLLTIQEQKPQ